MSKKLSMNELNRISIEDFKKSKKLPVVIILDNVRSMNNVGSIFRTSDAFRIEHIYLCGITAKPPHKEIEKTALGATLSVAWTYEAVTENVITTLKKQNFQIIAIEQVENSIELQDFKPDFNSKIALIFGNEIMGVEQKIIDISHQCVEIPQLGIKHSFNISVSVGIVLWHLFLTAKNIL